MDYIEGTGLDDILAEKGPLGEAETLKLLGPVAAALDYAHAKGVIHRDVKPGNVMVAKDGTPFVLDFGIAREIQETMTRVTGKFSSGTLLYMSPEQLNGRAPKAAQDVYSFAAMGYECLSGAPPFSRGQIEWQIVNNPPEPLEEGVGGVALREGIMAGLAKEPEKRPGSCAEVLGNGGASRSGEPEKGRAAGGAAGTTARPEGSPHQGAGEAERAVREAEARAEAERKARKEAEAKAAKAREEARARALEAMKEKEARGRVSSLAWELALVLIGAGVAGGVWWYNDHQGILRSGQSFQERLAALEQERSGWADKVRKAEEQAKAEKAAREELERQQAGVLESQRAQREKVSKAVADAKKKLQEQKEELDRQRSEWEAQVTARDAADAAKRKAEEEAPGEWDGMYTGADREVPLPHGAKMTLKWCPKGSFTMGSPSTEDGRYTGEVQHEVTLTRGFWMAETEVTQGQWKALMNGETVKDLARKALQDDTGYDFNDGKGAITMRERWGLERNSDPMNRCGDLDDDVPVYNVSWGEAKEFCRRLTEKGRNEGWLPPGYSFRLPTEAEWEYACRAGTKTALPNGKDIRILGKMNAPVLDDIAWYGGNSSVGFEGRGADTSNGAAGWEEKQYPGGYAWARKVGLKSPNKWGLYDMIGNVYEWCEDECVGYPTGAVTDYCKSNRSTAPGVHRVVRSGSWVEIARYCRSANRHWFPAGYRNNGIGFRPVCSAGTVQ